VYEQKTDYPVPPPGTPVRDVIPPDAYNPVAYPAPPTQGTPSQPSGGGDRRSSSGSPSSSGPRSTSLGVSGQVGGYDSTVAQPTLDWVNAILGGDFSALPMFDELTNPIYSDPTQNPYIQAMVGDITREMKADWLGRERDLLNRTEGAGRYGGGMYQGMSNQNYEQTQEALGQTLNQLYGNAYENERQRRAQLFPQFLGAQIAAAGLPIEVGNLGVRQGQLGINQDYLNLAGEQFDWTKHLDELAGQDNALLTLLRIFLMGGQAGNSGTSIIL